MAKRNQGKKLTQKVAGASDFRCPMHNKQVRERARRFRDENDELRYGGSYLACPEYAECGYYVAPEQGTRPVVDSEGRALGRTLRK